jgi:hypothetical protein
MGCGLGWTQDGDDGKSRCECSIWFIVPLVYHKRLEDTLGPGDDDGGGGFLHWGRWMLAPSVPVCGVPVSPLEGLEGASASNFFLFSPPAAVLGPGR